MEAIVQVFNVSSRKHALCGSQLTADGADNVSLVSVGVCSLQYNTSHFSLSFHQMSEFWIKQENNNCFQQPRQVI